jgi:hypothetical protein
MRRFVNKLVVICTAVVFCAVLVGCGPGPGPDGYYDDSLDDPRHSDGGPRQTY